MTDSSTGRNILSAAILTAGLLLAGYVYFTGEAPPPNGTALADAAVSQVSHSAKSTPAQMPIEQIRVGDRVKAYNPEVTAVEREGWQEPDWGDWVKLSLRVAKPNGSYADIELLRPRAWMDEHVVFAATRRPCVLLPPPASSEPEGNTTSLVPRHPVYCEQIAQAREIKTAGWDLVGLFAYLNLPEFGVQGLAVLTGIEPHVSIDTGKGHVVTGAFTHFSNDVIDLVVEDSTGQSQSIGTTANHPFWSADRQQFIPAGQLEKGENLSTISGDTHDVISKQPRKGITKVYNLEVHGEHVYYAGDDGVLVHNMCDEAGKEVIFAHGTHFESAEHIVENGLDAAVAASKSKGGTFSHAGAFDAHPLGPPGDPGPGLQLAFDWSRRHALDPEKRILIGKLDETLFNKLVKEGKIEIDSDIPGVESPQWRFLPDSFGEVNARVTWTILDPN